jgi:hypothetical protein
MIFFERPPEPAARAKGEKTAPRHNAASAPGQAGGEAAEGPISKPAKDPRRAKRRIEVQTHPVQAQCPELARGFRPTAAQSPLEAASAREKAGPGARICTGEAVGEAVRPGAGPKRALTGRSARGPKLGLAGRRLRNWLRRHFDSAQLESVEPMISELLSVTDALHQVRAELGRQGSGTNERIKLLRLQTQLASTFVKIWRVLGLDQDPPCALPKGRPPQLAE